MKWFKVASIFLNRYDPQKNEIGQTVQKKYNHEKEFSYSGTYPLEKKKVDISALTTEAPLAPLQQETGDVHLESQNLQPLKEVVPSSSKTIAALPQMESSPDVIIEEIIEENLESE